MGPGTLVRSARRAAAVAVLVWFVTLFGAVGAQAVPSVTYSCTPAPADCSGWFRSDVAIDWTVTPPEAVVTGCEDKTFSTDTPGTDESCSADDGTGPVTVSLSIKLDKTPPVVTGGEPARAADVDGWYNHAVPVEFAGSDLTSGIAGCTAATYEGPDTETASIEGSCTDQAGNVSAPLGYGLKYDATPPVVTVGRAARGPDVNGWYNRPVSFAFSGTDGTSGVGACTTATYSGPDSAAASVAGTCTDGAGNVGGPLGLALKYDATPPLLSLAAASGDRSVSLNWQTSPDAEAVEVLRTPGFEAASSSVVFSGPGASFVDARVDNGERYTYEVRVRDAAGNASAQSVIGLPAATAPGAAPPPASAVVPGPAAAAAPEVVPDSDVVPRPPRTVRPAPGSVFAAGDTPLLDWLPARRARYYNVQLFRGDHKLLSAWPTRTRYQLKLRWTFRRQRYRLTPGRYRWIVWPGYGRRAKPRYGTPIVRSSFEVRSPGALRASL